MHAVNKQDQRWVLTRIVRKGDVMNEDVLGAVQFRLGLDQV